MVAVAQMQQPHLLRPPAPLPAEDPSAEQDVVVFFGIIDILQVLTCAVVLRNGLGGWEAMRRPSVCLHLSKACN